MSPRMTEPRLAILVAMASRNKPLVQGEHRFFVPEWGGRIEAKDVSALEAMKCLSRDGSRTGRVLHLTPFGRTRAEAAKDRRAAE